MLNALHKKNRINAVNALHIRCYDTRRCLHYGFIILFFIFSLLAYSNVYAAPSFQSENLGNLRVEQKNDKIYIYYDIYPVGISTESYYVSIKASADGGKTYTIFPKALEGDFGANVKPAQAKQIIWDVTKDRDVLEGENFVFALTASDEGAAFVDDDDSVNKAPTKPSLDKTHTGGLSLQVVDEWGKEIKDYQIEIDGSKIDSITTNPILTLPAGAKTLKIKAEHYSDKQTTVYIAAGQNKVQKVELMRLRGSIAVTSSPPGADAFIDSKSVGKTNDVFPDFIDGNIYAVKVLLKGFVPLDAQHITVRGSETVTVHFSLISLPALSLAANVEDYDVYVDGSLKQSIKGQTGDITIDVAGKIKIKVVKKGYIDWTGGSELFAGKTTPVEIIMKQRNLLVVTSNAEGATVEVNTMAASRPLPNMDAPSPRKGNITSGKLEIWDIPAGTYNVVVDNGVKRNQMNAPVADNIPTTVDVQFDAKDLCKIKDKKVCEGNSLYWFDSCLNKGDLIKSCNSDEQCAENGCAPLLPTAPTGKCVQAACPSDMCYIPPGEFTMGCSPNDNECENNEKPSHKVRITKAFCMDKYEVMQGKYKSVMGNNPSYFSSCGDNCPVETVDWNNAKLYCEKAGKRLPSEAEWEYAARAGTTTKYYWGNSMDGNYAWYNDNSGQKTHTVGQKPGMETLHRLSSSSQKTHTVGQKQPNAFGLYDMLGNVWEWVEDCYDENWYSKSPLQDPKNTNSGCGRRVLRGGSWNDLARDGRVSYRDGNRPTGEHYGVGVRCLQDF